MPCTAGGWHTQTPKRFTWMAMRMPCTAGAHPLLAAMAASSIFRTRGARRVKRAALTFMRSLYVSTPANFIF